MKHSLILAQSSSKQLEYLTPSNSKIQRSIGKHLVHHPGARQLPRQKARNFLSEYKCSRLFFLNDDVARRPLALIFLPACSRARGISLYSLVLICTQVTSPLSLAPRALYLLRAQTNGRTYYRAGRLRPVRGEVRGQRRASNSIFATARPTINDGAAARRER